MKKELLDVQVVDNQRLHPKYCLLRLTSDALLPEMKPGQFVQVKVDGSPSTFLRRPISVSYIDKEHNELWLLVGLAGDGTRRMAEYAKGDRINIIAPLGKGFSLPQTEGEKVLLIGGGVGVAPLLFLGDSLKNAGIEPVFLLGARSEGDLLLLDEFRQRGTVHITTEDGSSGVQGFVTQHPVLINERFDRIYSCGPKPMMMAIAKYADSENINCEVSLENVMACGIGACLCCVEKTDKGNVCVCTEGPVFNIKQLTWLN